ncbi:MAG: cadmium-translocating P-type ATPase, partial [Oscillospiraceae bacterium]|nr:cadmium-translocating P-type ATPase [Oscillospiraceae bacterium]
MTEKQKRSLWRILAAIALFVAGLFCKGYVRLALMLSAWAITGWPVVRKAFLNIRHGNVFDEHFLMTVATVGAFALGEYPEGAAVMIFFQIGELFESLAVERSRRSIGELMDLRPDVAFRCDGEAVEEVDPDEILPGDLLLVKPGERIPVDGVVVEGSASLDTAQITGESLPVQVGEGMQVLSGCINLSGVLKIRAESAYEHSTVARILELVENATETKAPTERMITRFARVYTPAVVLCALALAVIPPLFDGAWGQWIKRALSFLVISCPCALVISVPLSFFGGMGAASKQGIIIKGGAVLEQLARVQTAAFDKTGTLTMGVFRVDRVDAVTLPEKDLLRYAAGAESMSSHPIGKAICAAVSDGPADVRVEQEEPGYGVCA